MLHRWDISSLGNFQALRLNTEEGKDSLEEPENNKISPWNIWLHDCFTICTHLLAVLCCLICAVIWGLMETQHCFPWIGKLPGFAESTGKTPSFVFFPLHYPHPSKCSGLEIWYLYLCMHTASYGKMDKYYMWSLQYRIRGITTKNLDM